MENAVTALSLPDKDQFVTDIRAVNQFQQIVRANMREGQDYGVIPGTNKPTLLKPGAEKIAKLLGLSDQYEILDKQEDWDRPLFRYLVKCKLISVNTGVLISEGLGECNSMESKYRWRWAWPDDVPDHIDKSTLKKKTGTTKYGKPFTMYQVENDDIFTQVNTLIKMAKKRALVDAALSAGRLSDIFTQDMEDIKGGVVEAKAEVKEDKPKAKPKKAEKKTETPNQMRESSSIKKLTELYKACHEDFGLQPGEVIKELGYSVATDITETPAECYAKIATTRS